jgi:hypothetical protein
VSAPFLLQANIQLSVAEIKSGITFLPIGNSLSLNILKNVRS